jgi:DNA mismatch endonuclease (patch repair protein)
MDTFIKEQRSRCMSKIRSKNTQPELKVRKILTGLGCRYRLHVSKLPGKPDIVLSKKRLAIFINGCFWHQHKGCKKQALPKSNTDYWHKKLKRNVERQKENIKILGKDGWRVLIIWECQTKNPDMLTGRLKKQLAWRKTLFSNWLSSSAAREESPLKEMLGGIVEVDETYIGGKTREGVRGRGSERKTSVLALVERKGRAVAKPVERVNADNLKGAIRELVDKDAAIMTDEWPSYRGIGSEFPSGYGVVQHGLRIYVDGIFSTNDAESFFPLLKRGVHGIFHHVLTEHLFRYCDEFSFRWSHRKVMDGQRPELAIKGAGGKRLRFQVL